MESVEELCDHVALIHQSKKILDGSKKQLKEQFKNNTYTVEFHGTLSVSEAVFTIQEIKPLEDNVQRAILKMKPDVSVNQLLQSVMTQVELRLFSENIPNMNEVFIRAVSS